VAARQRISSLLLLTLIGVLCLLAPSTGWAQDTDRDKMPDSWEKKYGLKVDKKDSLKDLDRDGLKNGQEFKAHTNPRKKDTDRDGMPDKWELDNKLNPRKNDANRDPDKDGLTNLEEYKKKTNPKAVDSDGDGSSDSADSSPNDASKCTPALSGSYVQGYTAGYSSGYNAGALDATDVTGESDSYNPVPPSADPAYNEGFYHGYDIGYDDGLLELGFDSAIFGENLCGEDFDDGEFEEDLEVTDSDEEL